MDISDRQAAVNEEDLAFEKVFDVKPFLKSHHMPILAILRAVLSLVRISLWLILPFFQPNSGKQLLACICDSLTPPRAVGTADQAHIPQLRKNHADNTL